MAAKKVDTYFVRYTDLSTGWIFVESGDEPPEAGDVYEGDDRVVGTATLQVAEEATDGDDE